MDSVVKFSAIGSCALGEVDFWIFWIFNFLQMAIDGKNFFFIKNHYIRPKNIFSEVDMGFKNP
jgi:hypothetical protein